jgi:phosphoesterase RecJ-like protein
MENIEELKVHLSTPKSIVITAHRNPDGDAIGASLGLYHFLNQFGHTVRIIFPSEYPSVFEWLEEVDKAIIYDLDKAKSEELVKEANIIFCLDYNSLDRVDKLGVFINESKAVKVMIDHHMDPEPFVDFMMSHPEASSTAEMIYTFIEQLGDKDKLNTSIGEAIFTGLLTDTGSFAYNTNPNLFRVASELKALGVDDYKLQQAIFNTLPEKNLRLLGHCLANRMEIIPELHTGIIVLNKEDYIKFDIQRGDSEGIVNYILSVKGIKVAAFIREQPYIVKLSLRSKGDFSVQEIARDHFNGGGHMNASGGYSKKGLKDTLEKFKTILPAYIYKNSN